MKDAARQQSLVICHCRFGRCCEEEWNIEKEKILATR
jgi:hypothetical protein